MVQSYFSFFDKALECGKMFKTVEDIFATDRYFDFAHFKKTAEYCAQRLTQMGAVDVERIPLKADGMTSYGDWVVPKAWDVKSASLSIAGVQFCDYSKVPQSLMMFSAPSNGEVTAEIIELNDFDAAKGLDLTGKFIFSAKAPGEIALFAWKHGAKGILSDFAQDYNNIRKVEVDVPDAVRWENALLYPNNNKGIFGFCLSKNQGAALREQLKNGKVQGVANVDTVLYDGEVDTVTAKIQGEQDDEIMLAAHLYEPGANDNATGAGVCLDLFEAIIKGIKTGTLPKPKKSLRIVLGYECIGMIGYVTERPELIKRASHCINLDMVAPTDDDKATLAYWHNPLSMIDSLDRIVPFITEQYSKEYAEFPFVEKRFELGDNLLSDPAIGVSCVSFLTFPAVSYHSSLDTMERVSAEKLKRTGLVAGAALLLYAYEPIEKIEALVEGYDSEWTAYAFTAIKNALSPASIDEIEKDSGMQATKTLIPTRNFVGCVTLAKENFDKDYDCPHFPYYDYFSNAATFWIDGKRSLYEIILLTAPEFRQTDIVGFGKGVTLFFAYLEKLGYIQY